MDVAGETIGKIGPGLMVLVGVENGDTPDDAKWLAAKTVAMRIFDDENGARKRKTAEDHERSLFRTGTAEVSQSKCFDSGTYQIVDT